MKLKLFLILSILLFGRFLSQSKTDLIEIENINKYSELIYKDPNLVEYKFQIENKGHLIYYKYQKIGNKIVIINRQWTKNNEEYTEIFTDHFLLQNDKKVYATQSIIYKNKSKTGDVGIWNCAFWIHKNKVMQMTSLGHGKTEDDTWDYEKELKENFNYMLKKVQEKDKIINKK